VIEAADVFPGPAPGTYAYSRHTVQPVPRPASVG